MALLCIREAFREFDTPEGGKITAMNRINLDIEENEFLTLLGPSGCGKTTLLRAISGLEELDGGQIILDGVDIAHLPPNRRPVNTVFQSYALFSHMSVARNIGYALEISKVDKAERDERVNVMMEKVGLAGMGSRKPSQLSGGQRQRVALARAIISEPRILLLDEPLSALDRNLRQQMQYELKSLQANLGITFIFVTHDQDEAMTMSDRIAILRGGQIEQIGSPKEIFRKPDNRFVAEFVGETNLFEANSNGNIAHVSKDLSFTLSNEEAARFNGPCLISLRPGDLRLGEGKNQIQGKVLKQVYTGANLMLFVNVDGHELVATLPENIDSIGIGDEILLNYEEDAVHTMAVS